MLYTCLKKHAIKKNQYLQHSLIFDRRTPSYPWERVIIYRERIQLAIIKKVGNNKKAHTHFLLLLFFFYRIPDEKQLLVFSLVRFSDLCERAMVHREINTRAGCVMNEGEQSYSSYFPWTKYSRF